MAVRIERLVTSGQFTLDDGSWHVDNNVWLVGDDHEAIVIDAAPALADRTGAPIFLHLDDRLLWKHTHPDRDPDGFLSDGRRFTVATTMNWPRCSPATLCSRAGREPQDVRTRTSRRSSVDTAVHTGHGDSTIIGAQAPHPRRLDRAGPLTHLRRPEGRAQHKPPARPGSPPPTDVAVIPRDPSVMDLSLCAVIKNA